MVNEEKETEQENPKEETTGEDNQGGDKPESTSPIDRANAAAERMEAANEKAEKILERNEELFVTKKLSGTTEAGSPQEVKEETPEEYTKRVMAGDLNE